MFFNAETSLVPADTNETADVYEYEPEGIGGCSPIAGSPAVVYARVQETDTEPGVPPTPGASGGCIGLISSGKNSQESVFIDASQSGEDVFFRTSAALVPSDTNGGPDIYDAHVCNKASPCPTEAPGSQPECDSLDECHGAASTQNVALRPRARR